MTRKQREQLCLLSENSFGTRYAWQSYLNTPHYVKEYETHNERFVKVAKWRTLEEVVELMGGKLTDIFPEEGETCEI